MAAPQLETLWPHLIEAEDIGLKLEMVGGLPTWEAFPSVRHQRAAVRICNSIGHDPATSGDDCGCFAYVDIYIRFGEDSFKRPDVSIFCQEPNELDGAVAEVPQAVVEVLSKGYERKDLEVGVPFYLEQGVGDVLVFDPVSLEIQHFTGKKMTLSKAPQIISLACGCTVSF